jgi:hypothetical protein
MIKPNKHIDESRDKSLIYLALGKGLPQTGRYRADKFEFIYLIFICSDDKIKRDKPSSLYTL